MLFPASEVLGGGQAEKTYQRPLRRCRHDGMGWRCKLVMASGQRDAGPSAALARRPHSEQTRPDDHWGCGKPPVHSRPKMLG
jgi:hypothetical protein